METNKVRICPKRSTEFTGMTGKKLHTYPEVIEYETSERVSMLPTANSTASIHKVRRVIPTEIKKHEGISSTDGFPSRLEHLMLGRVGCVPGELTIL